MFLNGHYLVVIRYCQSVKGKQRVFKKSLGNKSVQLKSQACVCDCHLLSLPWEKVMRLSSLAAVWALRVHVEITICYLSFLLAAALFPCCITTHTPYMLQI